MKVTLTPSKAQGKIKAIASKSAAHRILICSAFADAPTSILCEETNRDIEATVACLRSLGAKITRNDNVYEVTPLDKTAPVKNSVLPCDESGSTLRFLLPVACAIGSDSIFATKGRLSERPLDALLEELQVHGANVTKVNDKFSLSGKLTGNDFCICGNISSQFISGLLFAIAIIGEGSLRVTGKLESAPYVDMTLNALKVFGVSVIQRDDTYFLNANGGLRSPEYVAVEGDWSNAAFPLALGILGKNVEIFGLDPLSAQGDRAIVEIIRKMGGKIAYNPAANSYVANASKLHALELDATNVPDLVPVIATLASVADGESKIYGVERLRLKESDRIESIITLLSSLGANIRFSDGALLISGVPNLLGGEVDSFDDHRIAMSAAVASCVCTSELSILRAEAVQKSYPSFWNAVTNLSLNAKYESEK